MNVKKGVIEEMEITGNFFGTADMAKICRMLRGCRYEYGQIRERLESLMPEGAVTNISSADIAGIICER